MSRVYGRTRRKRQRTVLLRLLPILLSAILPTALSGEHVRVFVNHPPAGFLETLDAFDTDNSVLLSSEEWFDPVEAEIWVLFFRSDISDPTMSELAKAITRRSFGPESGTMIRGTAKVSADLDVTFQANNLSAAINPNFQGCISALDLIAFAKDDHPDLVETAKTHCEKYLDEN